MMRIIMLLVALSTVSLLTACGSPNPANEEVKPAALPTLPKTKMEQIADKMPVEQYPGSTLMVSSRKGAQRVSMFTTTDDYAKIVQHYKDFLNNDKWSIITIDEGPTESSLIASKGKIKLTIDVTAPQENVGAKVNTINITTEPRE